MYLARLWAWYGMWLLFPGGNPIVNRDSLPTLPLPGGNPVISRFNTQTNTIMLIVNNLCQYKIKFVGSTEFLFVCFFVVKMTILFSKCIWSALSI